MRIYKGVFPNLIIRSSPTLRSWMEEGCSAGGRPKSIRNTTAATFHLDSLNLILKVATYGPCVVRATTLHSRNKRHPEFGTDSRRNSRADALGTSRPISWREQVSPRSIRLHRRSRFVVGRQPLFTGKALETNASTAPGDRPKGPDRGVEEGLDLLAKAHRGGCLIRTRIVYSFEIERVGCGRTLGQHSATGNSLSAVFQPIRNENL